MRRPRVLTQRFNRALVCAARLHAGQFRKGSTRPYIAHLLGVTSIVLNHGGDEDEAIAALLHDGPEDQGGLQTLRDIRKKFGARVARIVDACTDTYEDPKPPWLERKKNYLRHLRHADASVRLVSAADKLYNVREILLDYRSQHDAVFTRFRGGKEGTIWYYREVARILRRKGPRALVRELERANSELERAVARRSPDR
ncbi:MAG TPA: HD domain-containing protein [Candidatus Sulfotelmatobacter sp.]|nr:HD domain-containing protein [Candidatus Sulfotelmatobacter sp.]